MQSSNHSPVSLSITFMQQLNIFNIIIFGIAMIWLKVI